MHDEQSQVIFPARRLSGCVYIDSLIYARPESCRLESFEDEDAPLGLLSPLVVAAIAACTGLVCVELRGRHPPSYESFTKMFEMADVVSAIQHLSSMPRLSRLVISPVGDAVLELTTLPAVPRGDPTSQQQQPGAAGRCFRWRRLALLDYPGHTFSYREFSYFGRACMTQLGPVIDAAEEVDVRSRQWSSVAIRGITTRFHGGHKHSHVVAGVRDAVSKLRNAATVLGGRAMPMELTLSMEYCDIALPTRLVDAVLPLSYCIRGLTLRGWSITKARLERLLSALPQLTRLSFECTWMEKAVAVALPSLLPNGLTRLDLGLSPRYTISDTRWQVSYFIPPNHDGIINPWGHQYCCLSDDVPGQGTETAACELIDDLPLQHSQLISLAKSLGPRAAGGDSSSSDSSAMSSSSPPYFTLGLSPLLLDELSAEDDLAGIMRSRAEAGRAQLRWLELEEERGAPWDHTFS